MGKNIVRRLHPDEPNKHSRLWIQEEIEDVLGNDLVRIKYTCELDIKPKQTPLTYHTNYTWITEATRCLHLILTPKMLLKGLGNMKKLRCLFLTWQGYDVELGVTSEDFNNYVKLDEVNQYFPHALRCLFWMNYPHWCLPKTFQVDNLVMLDMSYSNITKLWAGGKVMKKLKTIRLSASKSLRTLDHGLTPSLEWLDLEYFSSLKEIYVPVGSIKRLMHLSLGCCKRIESFSFIKELESLKVLLLNKLHLKEFPDIIPCHSNSSLQHLNFCENDIEYIPSSIGNLRNLVYLYLTERTKLKSLPARICSLHNLRVLDLNTCGIKELPEDIGKLECLETLYLTYSEVKHFPASIFKLKHLKTLILDGLNVRKLQEDFGQIDSLSKLSLRFSKIRDISSSICKLKHLEVLDLYGCFELEKLPENLADLESLKELNLEYTSISHLPHRISLLKGLRIVRYKETSDPDVLLSQQQMKYTRKRKSIRTKAPCDVDFC